MMTIKHELTNKLAKSWQNRVA